MDRSSKLVFPNQQAFVAVFENGLHVARVLRGPVSSRQEHRQLRFETALFVRRTRRGHGADAPKVEGIGRPASVDSAKESRVRGFRAHGRRAKIKSGNPN